MVFTWYDNQSSSYSHQDDDDERIEKQPNDDQLHRPPPHIIQRRMRKDARRTWTIWTMRNKGITASHKRHPGPAHKKKEAVVDNLDFLSSSQNNNNMNAERRTSRSSKAGSHSTSTSINHGVVVGLWLLLLKDNRQLNSIVKDCHDSSTTTAASRRSLVVVVHHPVPPMIVNRCRSLCCSTLRDDRR